MKSKVFNNLVDCLSLRNGNVTPKESASPEFIFPEANTAKSGLFDTKSIDETFLSIIGCVDHAPSMFLTFAGFIAKYKTETFGFTYSADSTRSRVAGLIDRDYNPDGAKLSIIRVTLRLRDYFEAAIAGEDLSALEGTQLMQDFISICEIMAKKNGHDLVAIAESIIADQMAAVDQSVPSESHGKKTASEIWA